jgi:hypothetical protein
MVTGLDPDCERILLQLLSALHVDHHIFSGGPLAPRRIRGSKNMRTGPSRPEVAEDLRRCLSPLLEGAHPSACLPLLAGALQAVQSGVLLIPAVHEMRPSQHRTLVHALETKEVRRLYNVRLGSVSRLFAMLPGRVLNR